MYPVLADREALEFWQNSDPKYRSKAISELDMGDVRRFCFKDCAIYTHTLTCMIWRNELFLSIFHIWFADHNKDYNICYSSFFARLILFKGYAIAALKDIFKLHYNLIAQLCNLVDNVLELAPFYPRHQRWLKRYYQNGNLPPNPLHVLPTK